MAHQLIDFDQKHDGPMLSVRECAEVLGLGVRTVRDMVTDQEIRGVQIGPIWKIPWRSMRAYLTRTHVLPLRPEERV